MLGLSFLSRDATVMVSFSQQAMKMDAPTLDPQRCSANQHQRQRQRVPMVENLSTKQHGEEKSLGNRNGFSEGRKVYPLNNLVFQQNGLCNDDDRFLI